MDVSGVAEPEAEVWAKPESLSPAAQRVTVKIIVKGKGWLTLKCHVEMDLAKSVESESEREANRVGWGRYWEDENEGPRV